MAKWLNLVYSLLFFIVGVAIVYSLFGEVACLTIILFSVAHMFVLVFFYALLVSVIKKERGREGRSYKIMVKGSNGEGVREGAEK